MEKEMYAGAATLTVSALYISEAHGTANAPVAELVLRSGHGIVGERHSGPTRVRGNGEVVPNLRHFTAVCSQELGEVADALGVPYIDPAWIGANICFACDGPASLTATLIEGIRLLDAESRAVLEVVGATAPCLDAGKMIAARFPLLSVAPERFPSCALGRRGVYGIILMDTTIGIGDRFGVAFSSR
jgi:hypothetical protein